MIKDEEILKEGERRERYDPNFRAGFFQGGKFVRDIIAKKNAQLLSAINAIFSEHDISKNAHPSNYARQIKQIIERAKQEVK